jgi:transposase
MLVPPCRARRNCLLAGASQRAGPRYGVSTETVRKVRKRGPQDCQDHAARPHRRPWKASEEERAMVCALRQVPGFTLDDLVFVVSHVLPHLNRDSIWRILRAAGLSRRPKLATLERWIKADGGGIALWPTCPAATAGYVPFAAAPPA